MRFQIVRALHVHGAGSNALCLGLRHTAFLEAAYNHRALERHDRPMRSDRDRGGA
jgi:hypothetical protein